MAKQFPINHLILAFLIVTAGLFFIFEYGPILDIVNTNSMSVKLLENLLIKTGHTQQISNLINSAIKDECQRDWMYGLVAHENGDLQERNAYWKNSMTCSDIYLAGINHLAADDRSLAEFAVTRRPDKEMSWLWLANVTQAEPASVIPLYQQALKIQPYNGLTWYRLGEAYESLGDLDSALEAFLISCENLNRGSNCYVRAGNIMEKTGDIPAAINFYRQSIFEEALKRADYLESQSGN